MAQQPKTRARFKSDGSVNPRSAKPGDLSPYVGPSGARRPVGWGGEKWLKANEGDFNKPGAMANRFPTQFEKRQPGDPIPGDKVKDGYAPPPDGTSIPTGNKAKSADYRQPQGRPGPDGISPAARKVGANEKIQREAWETALKGFDPETAKQLGPFKPQSPQDIQRAFDAIHTGSGGKSDGAGQVWDGPGGPAAKPSGGKQGFDAGAAKQFAAASQHYDAAHMTGHAASGDGDGDGGSQNHKHGTQNETNRNAIIAARQRRAAENGGGE